jgi:sugar O-acyltransferase (sialic acid O-acetyltransferase NeuD family)
MTNKEVAPGRISKVGVRTLILVGAGGHAASCADIALMIGYQSLCFVDAQKDGSRLLGFPIVSSVADACDGDVVAIFIAIGDNAARQRVKEEVAGQFPNSEFPSLVHPTASLSHFSTIANGAVLMAGAIVGVNSCVGRFCILNTSASINHDCVMEEYSSLAPAVATGGRVCIGTRSAVAIGATIKHGVKIGKDVVIGANSYVNKSVADNVVCYGTPASAIRSRTLNDPYLL